MSTNNDRTYNRSAPYNIAQSFGASVRKILSRLPLPSVVTEMLNDSIDNDASTSSRKSNDLNLDNNDHLLTNCIEMPYSKPNYFNGPRKDEDVFEHYESHRISESSGMETNQSLTSLKRRQDNNDDDAEDITQSYKRVAMEIRGRPSISQLRLRETLTSDLSDYRLDSSPLSTRSKPSVRELALTKSVNLTKFDLDLSMNASISATRKSESSVLRCNTIFSAAVVSTKNNVTLMSPFYKGITTYGGSGSFYRCEGSTAKMAKKTAPLKSELGSNLSSTAKKIFKVLENAEIANKNSQDEMPLLSQTFNSPLLCKPEMYKKFSKGILPIKQGPPTATLSRPLSIIDQSDHSQFNRSNYPPSINKETKYIGKMKVGKQAQVETVQITPDIDVVPSLMHIQLPIIKLQPFQKNDDFSFSLPLPKKQNTQANTLITSMNFKFNHPVVKKGAKPDIVATSMQSQDKQSLKNFTFNPDMAIRKETTSIATTHPVQKAQALQNRSVLEALKTSSSSTPPSLSTLFKTSSADKWLCPTCMVSNGNDVGECPCCYTPRPSKTPVSTTNNVIVTSISTTQPSLSDMFKKSSANWACSTCFVSNPDSLSICPCCQTNRPNDGSQKEKKLITNMTVTGPVSNNNYIKSDVPKSSLVTIQFGNEKTNSNNTLTHSNETALTNGMLMSTNSDMYQISSDVFHDTHDKNMMIKQVVSGDKNEKNPFSGGFKFSGQMNELACQVTTSQGGFQFGNKNTLLNPIQFKPKTTNESKETLKDIQTNNNAMNVVFTTEVQSVNNVAQFGGFSLAKNRTENATKTSEIASSLITTGNSLGGLNSLNSSEKSATNFQLGFTPNASALAKQSTVCVDSTANTFKPINFGFINSTINNTLSTSVAFSTAPIAPQPINFGFPQDNKNKAQNVPISSNNSLEFGKASTSSSVGLQGSAATTISAINVTKTIVLTGLTAQSTNGLPTTVQASPFKFGNDHSFNLPTNLNMSTATSTSSLFSLGGQQPASTLSNPLELVHTTTKSFSFGSQQLDVSKSNQPIVTATSMPLFQFGSIATKAPIVQNSLTTSMPQLFNFGQTEMTISKGLGSSFTANAPNAISSSNGVSGFNAPSVTSSAPTGLFSFQALATSTTSSFFKMESSSSAQIQPPIPSFQTNGGNSVFTFNKSVSSVTASNIGQPFMFGNTTSSANNNKLVSAATVPAFNFGSVIQPATQQPTNQQPLNQQPINQPTFMFGQQNITTSVPPTNVFGAAAPSFNFAASANGLPQNFAFGNSNQNNQVENTPFQFGQTSVPTGFNFQATAVASNAPTIFGQNNQQSSFSWNAPASGQNAEFNMTPAFNFGATRPTSFTGGQNNQSVQRTIKRALRRHR